MVNRTASVPAGRVGMRVASVRTGSRCASRWASTRTVSDSRRNVSDSPGTALRDELEGQRAGDGAAVEEAVGAEGVRVGPAIRVVVDADHVEQQPVTGTHAHTGHRGVPDRHGGERRHEG